MGEDMPTLEAEDLFDHYAIFVNTIGDPDNDKGQIRAVYPVPKFAALMEEDEKQVFLTKAIIRASLANTGFYLPGTSQDAQTVEVARILSYMDLSAITLEDATKLIYDAVDMFAKFIQTLKETNGEVDLFEDYLEKALKVADLADNKARHVYLVLGDQRMDGIESQTAIDFGRPKTK